MVHFVRKLWTFLVLVGYDVCFGSVADERLRKFSTKTTYENSILLDELHYNISASEAEWSAPGCRPVLVVGLYRHGIRYPGAKDIRNIAKVVFKMKVAGGDAAVVHSLETVANKFLITEATDLAATGKRELKELGKRFGKKAKNTMEMDGLDSSSFGFYSSSKSRAIGSCENFKSGFVDSAKLPFGVGTNIDDHLLRFFDECSRYVNSVSENASAAVETQKFQEFVLPGINARLAKRIGAKHLDLEPDEMKSVLVMAGTEVAVFGTSTWSQLLSDEDLELLEYASDIKNYWKKSYGFPINYEQSCTLLRHMLQHLEDFTTCRARKKGVFYFGHTETIIPVLSILGLFRDAAPLMADNYNHHHKRVFRTSHVSPFASNLAFVLSDCSNEVADCSKGSMSEDRFHVRFLFKERPVVLPACGDVDCPYSVIRNHFTDIIKCNFSELCWDGLHEEL